MKRFDLYVGHNYDNGKQWWSRAEVLAAISNCAAATGVRGYTIVDGIGFWEGQAENTSIVTVYDCGTTEDCAVCVNALACALAVTLKQHCVLVAESDCTTRLVAGAA